MNVIGIQLYIRETKHIILIELTVLPACVLSLVVAVWPSGSLVVHIGATGWLSHYDLIDA